MGPCVARPGGPPPPTARSPRGASAPRRVRAWAWVACLAAVSTLALPACKLKEGQQGLAPGQAVKISFIHTTDWHSRLVPYFYQSTRTDRILGIDERYAPFGGLARMAYLIKQERARGDRVLHLDSGDVFQGAPIFNFFDGEVEIRAMSFLGVDVHTLGNHDFDLGSRNVYDQLLRHARYPVLAANYAFLQADDPRGIYLGDRVRPYTILNANGLKVGVIGMGNISSMTSVGEGGNSLGIQPFEEVEIIQSWVDFLQPQVDVIVLLSHMGLGEDERLIRQTRGLDLVFGGHHHVVLNPPKVVEDAAGRGVPLIHSGVFLKFFCVLDAVVQDGEVISTNYRITPVDSRVPEDREALQMLEPYLFDMNTRVDLRRVLAYAPKSIPRFGKATGDSALGDLVADAMRKRRQVETDFALTNSLGIRADFSPGPITEELLFNVFPFENSVAKMMLSGEEIVEMLDFLAQRSASRGCQSQAQVAGIRYKMHCLLDEPTGSWSDEIYVGGTWDGRRWVGGEQVVGARVCVKDKRFISPLSYEVAVNDYIARGGSGFKVLKVNTSKVFTGIAIRTVVADHLRKLPACGSFCEEGTDSETCMLLRNCVESLTEYYADVCRVPWLPCKSNSDCPDGKGCYDEICQTCEGDDCSGALASRTCRADADCGEGEVCDPVRVNETLDAGDVLFCYREDCWEAARVYDPTRVPYYCRADVEESCVAKMRARAAEQCPQLPCVMVEEDGRIGRVSMTINDVAPACLPEADDNTGAAGGALEQEVDRCASDGICWE